jgi:hypothetical protein
MCLLYIWLKIHKRYNIMFVTNKEHSYFGALNKVLEFLSFLDSLLTNMKCDNFVLFNVLNVNSSGKHCFQSAVQQYKLCA